MGYEPTYTTIIVGSTDSPDGNAVYDYVDTGDPFLPLVGGTLTGAFRRQIFHNLYIYRLCR